MMFWPSFSLVLLLVFVCIDIGSAIECKSNAAKTITVDLSGHGNFSKIQDAIDFIPSDNTQWIRISLSPGIYREQVKIPQHKSCILLEGQSLETTSIEFNAHEEQDTSPTFAAEGDNFVAKQIFFKNTYNGPLTPAVAIGIKGDKVSFHNCGFYGIQDTVWDVKGRHFFQNCVIQGSIDFICGSGQSIYKDCQIIANGTALSRGSLPSFITAQERDKETEENGFVFIGGSVTGTGSFYLGRALEIYSRVIFNGTMFSEVVTPEGWNAWNARGKEELLTYAEYDCHGPGSDTSKRVSWEKKLSPDEVHQFSDLSFIDKEGWLSKQP